MANTANDQAAGLRRIFAAETVRVMACIGEQSATISTALAVALASHGKRVLVVDEQLQAGQTHTLMNLPCAADLRDVLKGKKALREILCSVAEIGLMPGAAGSAIRESEAERVGLLETFYELAIGYDFVIVNASTQPHHGLGFSQAASELMVLCNESNEGIMHAYRQIKRLAQLDGGRRFMMVFHGAGGAFAKGLHHKLTLVCKKYLQLMPEFTGILPQDKRLAAQLLEKIALDILHWPIPEEGDASRFEMFMYRLLTATGSSNFAAA